MKRSFIILFLYFLQINVFSQIKADSTYVESYYQINALKLQSDRDAVTKALAKDSWWRNSMETHDQRTEWFENARFGMFIHWGVYSLAGGVWNGKPFGGYAEQILRIKNIPRDTYQKELIDNFNPLKFDAAEWMKTAKDAGMKYMIITAKHHDGFAMWPSNAYSYDIRLSPFKRDPMMELRDAAKKYGIKFGFYYSQAQDWEHIDASGRNWDKSGNYVQALTNNTTDWNKCPQCIPRLANYVDQKVIPQLKELAEYDPDIFWFDTSVHLPLSENIRILENIRQFAPDVVVNGRLAKYRDTNFGDYMNTSDKPAFFRPQNEIWEGIPTTNESYGYSEFDLKLKPASHFIGLLAGAANKGGNILMNIGPMGNGEIAPRDLEILKGIGEWMKVNGEAIYGTSASSLPVQTWGQTTQKGNMIYLLVNQWPKDGKLVLGGVNGNIEGAYLLADKNTFLKAEVLNNRDLIINVPIVAPSASFSVIALKMNGQPKLNKEMLLSKDMVNTLQAFNADTIGRGFRYGSGKMFAQYIENWVTTKQALQWKTRLNEPAKFNIILSYNTAGDEDTGKMAVIIDNQTFPVEYVPANSKEIGAKTLQIGSINLNAANHVIQLIGVSYTGKQFMRPLDITLHPIK